MKRFPWQKSITKPIDKQIAYENLKLAVEALEKLEVPFFLSSGTLLGFYRGGDFIDHDEDIDLGVFIDFYKPEIVKEFNNKGFSLNRTFGAINSGLEYSFLRKGVQLDIFFYYKKNNTMWHAVWYVNKYINFKFLKKIGVVRPKLKKLSFPLLESYKQVNYKDLKLPIPNNTEDYLKAQYGENWRIPDRKWDNFKSQKNYIK